MLYLFNILLSIILYLTSCYNISFLLNKHIKWYLFLIGSVFFILLVFIPMPFSTLYQIIVLIITFYFNNKNLKKVISAVFFNYFSLLIIDTILSMLLIILSVKLNQNIIYITSSIISILSCFLIRMKLFLQLWNLIQDKFEKYIYILVAIILVLLYINFGYQYDIINVYVLVLFILIFAYIMIKQLVQSHIIKTESEKMLEYIEIYEKQINEFRINQHEYKNTLLCIKEMVPQKNQAREFIDSLLMSKDNEDNDILKNVLKIQISPIKGLIYQKLLLCKEKGIYSILNISSGIDFKRAKKIDIDTLKDITIILGVLLDNAIESSLETTDKSLSIYMYEENNKIVFQISNTFKGIINIDLLYKSKYSTKGKNRGYGLALVKKRIKENSKLSIKSEISNDVFIQYLQVKLDK